MFMRNGNNWNKYVMITAIITVTLFALITTNRIIKQYYYIALAEETCENQSLTYIQSSLTKEVKMDNFKFIGFKCEDVLKNKTVISIKSEIKQVR